MCSHQCPLHKKGAFFSKYIDIFPTQQFRMTLGQNAVTVWPGHGELLR